MRFSTLALPAAASLAGALAATAPALSQGEREQRPGREPITVERLYSSPSLTGTTPRALSFSPDGQRVTFLQGKEDNPGQLDLWAMDLAGGDPYLLVDSALLDPDPAEMTETERQLRERARLTGSGIVRYQWDSTGETILVPLGGDVFQVDVESGESTRLLETEAFETDIRLSPDGRTLSFIRDQNLVLLDIGSGEETAITTQGGGLISYGMAEFVAQEELDRSTGYWWSPDSRFIAFSRVDETPVDNIPRLEIAADGGATLVDQRYPRAGTDNAIVDLHIIDLETGQTVDIPLGEDPQDRYLARVNWAADSATAYVQVLNRLQTRIDVLAADPVSGETGTWYSESSDIWINLTNNFTPLRDGRVLWTTENTPGGFRHIILMNEDGEIERQLTSGEFVVDDILAIDSEHGAIYFDGWTETPLETHVYRTTFDGDEPRRITSGEGRWGATFNSTVTAFIGAYSDPDTPPQTALYDAEGERVRWVEENRLDASHPYWAHLGSHEAPEYGTLEAADGTELHYALWRPADFDPDETYPAIQYVYGGPHAQIVHRGWQSLRAQLFTDAGYVYFAIDNRGAWNRGREFEGHIRERMGSVEVEDQLVGLDYLQSLDFVDPERVGIWGWSYGGYMTLMTTLQAPGRYAAGVSGAPVTDWALYDTAYTERYMSHPDLNYDGYEQGAAFAHLDGYETPLFLIHGMSDDNVIFAHSTRLYAELQARGEAFEMMTYPGQRHGVRGPAARHLWTAIMDFFERKLQAGE